MKHITKDTIQETREQLGSAIAISPCALSNTISEMCGCKAFFKFENLQMTGSFKERGALSKLLSLTPDERSRGVLAASAGNHALGIAYHARRLSIPCTVVMPQWTPLIKITNVRREGAEVVIAGANYDGAYAHALELQPQKGCVFVHPFDDYSVIAGQGTIGLEILQQVPDVDAVIVPVGGGGLIAGIATAIKETNPRVQVIGVQSTCIPSMKASVDRDTITSIRPEGRTIADGIAVQKPGGNTFPIIQKYVDRLVTCDDGEIANAILHLLEIEKTVAEGAGAIPLAALENRDLGLAGKKVVMVVSGGNIDVNLLARIIERGLVQDGRLVRIKVCLKDQPGALVDLATALASTKANISQVRHQRAFTQVTLGEALVELELETHGKDHIEAVLEALASKGYDPEVVDNG